MLAINSSTPDYEFITNDVDAILAGAQLNIDALVHQQGASASEANQKPPKINPSINIKDMI